MPSESTLPAGLPGRVIVVTGAAGTIGAAVARQCTADGATVVAVDRDADRTRALLEELRGQHTSLTGDVTDPEFRRRVFDEATSAHGRVDGFVDCAGVLVPTALGDVDDAMWDLHLRVNVTSAFGMAMEAARAIGSRDGNGRIVLMSSVSWMYGGTAGRLPYASSKGAVITMARGLARELGPRGITVNVVAPGLVDSPMMSNGLAGSTRQRLIEDTPLRRFATPEEVAGPIAFLLSDRAAFVTGATLTVSGGYALH